MRYVRSCAVLVAILAIAGSLWGCAASADSMPSDGSGSAEATGAPGSSSALATPTPEQIAGRIQGVESVALELDTDSVKGAQYTQYVDPATRDEYSIDEQTAGNYSFTSSLLDKPRETGATLPIEKIEESAAALLERCFAGSPDDLARMRRDVRSVDYPPISSEDGRKSAGGYSDVEVQYRLIKDGVEYPTALSATYDGVTGDLLSMSLSTRPVTVDLEPTITRGNVEATMTAKYAAARVEVTDLWVWDRPGVKQKLVWKVLVEDAEGGSPGEVWIDAHVGSILAYTR